MNFFFNDDSSLRLPPDRRVPLLGQPAALPVFPGFVPDGSVRGGAGLLVSRGATSESCRPRGLGPVRAAAAVEVIWPKRTAV